MDEAKVQRINELARKSKTPQGLTPEEKQEQAALRQEYIDAYRRNLEAQLDNTYILDDKGVKHKLHKREEPKGGIKQ